MKITRQPVSYLSATFLSSVEVGLSSKQWSDPDDVESAATLEQTVVMTCRPPPRNAIDFPIP